MFSHRSPINTQTVLTTSGSAEVQLFHSRLGLCFTSIDKGHLIRGDGGMGVGCVCVCVSCARGVGGVVVVGWTATTSLSIRALQSVASIEEKRRTSHTRSGGGVGALRESVCVLRLGHSRRVSPRLQRRQAKLT